MILVSRSPAKPMETIITTTRCDPYKPSLAPLLVVSLKGTFLGSKTNATNLLPIWKRNPSVIESKWVSAKGGRYFRGGKGETILGVEEILQGGRDGKDLRGGKVGKDL